MAGLRFFKLCDRRGAFARGLSCDEGGVFLGADFALVKAATDPRGRRLYEARDLAEINAALSAAYGDEVDFTSRLPGLRQAPRYLSEGKWALAQIAALHLRLPDLPDDAAAMRLRKAEALLRYNSYHRPAGPGGGQFTSAGSGETQSAEARSGRQLLPRDKIFLDKYYDAVNRLSQKYLVDPKLVLGLAYESGFGSEGTYHITHDAFGMTGGSTAHTTFASSPEENVQQLFHKFGSQIYGTGSDVNAFVNALQGRNAAGERVAGWRVYNTERAGAWLTGVMKGIGQMKWAVPHYLQQRGSRG